MECFKREEVGAWRATLLDLMDAWAHEPAVQELAAAAVKDPDSLTRAAAALHQADQPSGAMKLAQIAISRKDAKAAEQWFAKAVLHAERRWHG